MFGGGSEQRTEYRRDQYTMEGVRNMGGGALSEEGKQNAQSAECIAADAGARSQGAMAGTSNRCWSRRPSGLWHPLHWMVSRWMGVAC